MPVKAYRELILSPSITNTHLNKTMRVFENIPKPGFLKIFARITRIPHSVTKAAYRGRGSACFGHSSSAASQGVRLNMVERTAVCSTDHAFSQ